MIFFTLHSFSHIAIIPLKNSPKNVVKSQNINTDSRHITGINGTPVLIFLF